MVVILQKLRLYKIPFFRISPSAWLPKGWLKIFLHNHRTKAEKAAESKGQKSNV